MYITTRDLKVFYRAISSLGAGPLDPCIVYNFEYESGIY